MPVARWNPRLLVIALGLLAYGPALSAGFLYDDHILIESNAALRSWSLDTLRHDFTRGVFDHPGQGVDFYRPLQTLSTRLEYTLVQLHPFLYHLTNLLVHLGNALLVYALILALGFEVRVAALASCFFVAHPIIVEQILMVSGRGELLGFFFTLSSILFVLDSGRYHQLLALFCFLLALFSKESAIIAPCLLALVLYVKRSPLPRYSILLPMALVTVFYLILRHHAMGTLLPGFWQWPWIRFMVMAFPYILVSYGRILLVPYDLHTDRLLAHPYFHWAWATAFVFMASVWVIRRGPRWAVFCWGWYILNWLPKSILMISGNFMSDHWAYPALVSIGLPLSVALSRGWNSSQTWARRTSAIAASALLFLETGAVRHNIATRNTDEKLYRSALRYSASPTLRYNLGIVLLRQGRFSEAGIYFEDLLAKDPNDSAATEALAVSLWKSGQRPRAIDRLTRFLADHPSHPSTRALLQEIQASR